MIDEEAAAEGGWRSSSSYVGGGEGRRRRPPRSAVHAFFVTVAVKPNADSMIIITTICTAAASERRVLLLAPPAAGGARRCAAGCVITSSSSPLRLVQQRSCVLISLLLRWRSRSSSRSSFWCLFCSWWCITTTPPPPPPGGRPRAGRGPPLPPPHFFFPCPTPLLFFAAGPAASFPFPFPLVSGSCAPDGRTQEKQSTDPRQRSVKSGASTERCASGAKRRRPSPGPGTRRALRAVVHGGRPEEALQAPLARLALRRLDLRDRLRTGMGCRRAVASPRAPAGGREADKAAHRAREIESRNVAASARVLHAVLVEGLLPHEELDEALLVRGSPLRMQTGGPRTFRQGGGWAGGGRLGGGAVSLPARQRVRLRWRALKSPSMVETSTTSGWRKSLRACERRGFPRTRGQAGVSEARVGRWRLLRRRQMDAREFRVSPPARLVEGEGFRDHVRLAPRGLDVLLRSARRGGERAGEKVTTWRRGSLCSLCTGIKKKSAARSLARRSGPRPARRHQGGGRASAGVSAGGPGGARSPPRYSFSP